MTPTEQVAIKQRIEAIEDRIRAAAFFCDRDPETIRLVAVSKTMPMSLIQEAVDAGVRLLGESYIQEARDKIGQLQAPQDRVAWHFIGHLQTNKVKYAVGAFDLIHSVDSLRLAQAIDRQARKMDLIQDILIQVNISRESTKSGVDTDAAVTLVRETSQLPHVKVRGLMTLPPFFDEPEQARPYFAALRHLGQKIIKQEIPGVCMDELSMGMTGDFEVAIEEGATLVRIGTAIFGERK